MQRTEPRPTRTYWPLANAVSKQPQNVGWFSQVVGRVLRRQTVSRGARGRSSHNRPFMNAPTPVILSSSSRHSAHLYARRPIASEAWCTHPETYKPGQGVWTEQVLP
jgi:hypothetical protein